MNDFYIIKDSALMALTDKGRRQETFVLPEGIEAFAEEIFHNVTVREITFPASLKYIPSGILADHTELEKVTISDGTERIMEFAFYGCNALKEIVIPESVKGIERYAFRYCSSLKSVNLPDGLETLGFGAFNDCTALEKIRLPKGLKALSEYVCFGGCYR